MISFMLKVTKKASYTRMAPSLQRKHLSMPSEILLVDNYDSFTYNLVQILEKVNGMAPDICYNDRIPLDELHRYRKVMISPGPGLPESSGMLMPMLEQWAHRTSIFGVCLGHQALGIYAGAQLKNLPEVYHGLAREITVIEPGDALFKEIPPHFMAGRYHSWVISRDVWPQALQMTAADQAGEAMAIRHRHLDLCGVQFHPESILTEYGEQMIRNWLES
jgi:anthranilate synthase component 2